MGGCQSDQDKAHLNAVLEVSRLIGATVELMPLLKSIERAALKVLSCERASVFLYDPTNDELYSMIATGVEGLRLSAKRGIAGEVVRTRKIINVPDAYADPRFNPDVDRHTGYRTRSILTFPLIGYDDRLVGVLQVLNKTDGGFVAVDEQLAGVLSSLAGVAVQRQMLLEEYAEKQKLERDLDLARSIQQQLLPDEPPQLEGFDIAGWNKPADQTGGDCFDFLVLEDGRLALMVADATGHGIGPALVIAECRALLRAVSSMSRDLPAIMDRVNALLAADLPADCFVTAFFGWIDPAAGALNYISAGHGPLLLCHTRQDEIIELPATSLPLGILPDLQFGLAEPIRFHAGDLMLIMTDGFFEWARPDGEEFGTQRVSWLLREHRDRPAADVIHLLQ